MPTNRPRKLNKNVTLPPGFPAHLRQLRESHHLSKTDLADKAGSTYRTVHDLETDRRERAQQKTIMVLSEALGVSYDELMMRDDEAVTALPEPRSRRRLVSLLVALLLIFAGTAWSTWNFATNRAEWTRGPKDLSVRDGIFGIELWSLHSDALFTVCKPAPWNDRILLVGFGNRALDGGRLVAFERTTGQQIWEVFPNLEQLNLALGEDIVSAAMMGCKSLDFLDVDGDGHQEILVSFVHGLYHPTALCLVDRDGKLRQQYAHKGHLLSLLALDIDNDGKDEVVASGVNNAPAYDGPTLVLLDQLHWRGASIDSLCNPWSSEPDSSLVRVVIPCFPAAFQARMKDSRLSAFELRPVPQPDGRAFLSIRVHDSQNPLMSIWVMFDDDLQVVDSAASDAFLDIIARDWPDSLKNGTGPGDEAWRNSWLDQASYFGAGR